MIGETLDGKYEILRKVGSGGMGSVYEARHRGTGRRVAVKVITGEFAKNETLLKRFHIEAMASGAIETQHIVQVLDTGTDPASGLPFMVMEFLDGEDLAAVHGRLEILPPELALRIAAQACLGLQKAHDARVVHRDIKPGNLFLSKRDDGELLLKLLDFGIAKIKLDRVQQLEASGLTRTGHVLGSPHYMSPEQARGHKNIDHRSDIWSLGVVLYELLAGRRPHEDIDALGELIIAICSEPPRPIQDFAPWVPPAIAAIVHGTLLFDPAERYQSASQLLAAIKPLLPSGWALTEAMLVTLPEEAKQIVAPRFEPVMQSGSHAIYRPNDGGVSSPGLEPTIAEGPFSPSPAPAVVPSSPTDTAFQASLTAAPPRATSRAAVRAAAVLGASAAIGYAALRVLAPSPAPQGSATPEPLASPPAAASAPPVATSAPPAASSLAPPSAAASVTVKLVLLDTDVGVELDGQRVVPNERILEITGPIDSVHKVRLSRGTSEVTGEITVTKDGPSPPMLGLPKKAAPSASPAGGPQAR